MEAINLWNLFTWPQYRYQLGGTIRYHLNMSDSNLAYCILIFARSLAGERVK
jgi:hypothetical protein